MWGYGTRGLRFGKAIDSVGALLAEKNLSLRLAECESHLRAADIQKAYTSMTGIGGIRSPFFTKYLYFLGRAVSPDGVYPLILDSVVAESLGWLTGLRYFAKVNSYWLDDDPESYEQFVFAIHRWARRYNTTADAIEFYLWRPSQPAFRDTCMAGWTGPATGGHVASVNFAPEG